jgi:hypothetical protein
MSQDDPTLPETVAPRRRDWRLPALIGVGVAAVLGLALGLWVRPNLDAGPAATAAANAPMPIVVAPSVPPAATSARSGGKMEVLPPDMAAAANAWTPAEPQPAAPYVEGAPAATMAPADPGPPQAPPQPPPQA